MAFNYNKYYVLSYGILYNVFVFFLLEGWQMDLIICVHAFVRTNNFRGKKKLLFDDVEQYMITIRKSEKKN